MRIPFIGPPIVNWLLRRGLMVFWVLLVANGHAATYSTNFANTENPLSENGNWINGGATGLDWSDCQELGGHASGTQIYLGADNDSTAVLAGSWAADQSARATVISGDWWPSSIEEVELRLRTTIKPHQITGYEFDFRVSSPGGYVAIVRWNGPLGDFTSLGGQNASYQGIRQGDVLLATAVGSTLSAYVNGVLVARVEDSTFVTGSPGVGFWMSDGGKNESFGLAGFSASDSGGSGAPPPPPSAGPYAAWEASLLAELRSIGLRPSQLNSTSSWLSTHPPTP